MIEEQIEDGTPKRDVITKWLAYYGIHEYVEIEDEALDFLCMALMKPDVKAVRLNGEGGIVIEYDEDNPWDTEYVTRPV
jgi:hypothetical protein